MKPHTPAYVPACLSPNPQDSALPTLMGSNPMSVLRRLAQTRQVSIPTLPQAPASQAPLTHPLLLSPR